jgi:hypothetical protein
MMDQNTRSRQTWVLRPGDTIREGVPRNGGDPMRTILIVANQTLPGDPLAREVADRIVNGATDFFIVVPVTPAPGGGLTWDEEEARRSAEERLAAFVERLRAQGVNATGEIGDRDPVQAVRDAARGLDLEEVILSTLPAGRSRWLRQDIPSRPRDAVDVPVAVVVEREATTAATR